MEKIKDFLYYIGDFLIGLFILAMMFFLITWKLSDTIPLELSSNSPDISKEQSINEDDNTPIVIDAGVEKDSPDRPKEDPKDNDSTANKDDKKDTQNTTNETSETSEDGIVTITIESGMSGVDIAYKLEEKGVVESADLFIAKLKSMELTESLLAGEFKIKKGLSYEEIAKILTGQ